MKAPNPDDTAVQVMAYMTDENFGYDHWRASQFSSPLDAKHKRPAVLLIYASDAERRKAWEQKAWAPQDVKPAARFPPVRLQDGLSPEWTCDQCGKDALFCEHAGKGAPAQPPPAPFEALRRFATEAVDQLVKDMAAQQAAYCVPDGDALALLRAVAKVRGESPWSVWETWALRHAIPVHEMLTSEADVDYAVLRARLRDLLGYAILGLVLAEQEEQNG